MAYEGVLDGKTVNPFVVAQVGEEPLAGNPFNYRLRIDPSKLNGDQIELVDVVIDGPQKGFRRGRQVHAIPMAGAAANGLLEPERRDVGRAGHDS